MACCQIVLFACDFVDSQSANDSEADLPISDSGGVRGHSAAGRESSYRRQDGTGGVGGAFQGTQWFRKDFIWKLETVSKTCSFING